MRKIDKLDVIHIKKKLEHHVIVFMKIAECLSFQKNYKNQTLNSVFGPIAQLDRATDF